MSTRAALTLEHHTLSDELAAKFRILADLLPQEREIKVNTFLAATGSDKVRGNAGDQASLHLTTQILETQQRIEALKVEIDNVRIQLAYTV